jgi:hypothetical protein
VVSPRGHQGEVASLNAGRSDGAWPTTTRSSVRRVFPGDSIKQLNGIAKVEQRGASTVVNLGSKQVGAKV